MAAALMARSRAAASPRMPKRRRTRRAPSNERFGPLHHAADRDLAARRRRDGWWSARLSMAAGVGAAAGRFSLDPGDDAASRRLARHDGGAGDGAAGAPVRPDPVARHHDVVEFLRHQPGHAAVRPQPRHRLRLARRAGRDQRGGLRAAAQPSLSAGLFQGEPGGHADRDAGAAFRHGRVAQLERSGRYAAGAAPERDQRRRQCGDAGRHQAGGAHPGRSRAPCRLRHGAGRHPPGDRERECGGTEGRVRRCVPVLHHRRE